MPIYAGCLRPLVDRPTLLMQDRIDQRLPPRCLFHCRFLPLPSLRRHAIGPRRSGRYGLPFANRAPLPDADAVGHASPDTIKPQIPRHQPPRVTVHPHDAKPPVHSQKRVKNARDAGVNIGKAQRRTRRRKLIISPLQESIGVRPQAGVVFKFDQAAVIILRDLPFGSIFGKFGHASLSRPCMV